MHQYNRAMNSLSEAALAFAKECLNRPKSQPKDDEVETGFEFNLGPPGYLDATSFSVHDLQRIMQMVTSWCQHHGLQLALLYSNESYTCTLTDTCADAHQVAQITEFSDHDVACEAFAPCADACYVLLGACVHARRNVRRLIDFYESLID
jgi:hypothetical protein